MHRAGPSRFAGWHKFVDDDSLDEGEICRFFNVLDWLYESSNRCSLSPNVRVVVPVLQQLSSVPRTHYGSKPPYVFVVASFAARETLYCWKSCVVRFSVTLMRKASMTPSSRVLSSTSWSVACLSEVRGTWSLHRLPTRPSSGWPDLDVLVWARSASEEMACTTGVDRERDGSHNRETRRVKASRSRGCTEVMSQRTVSWESASVGYGPGCLTHA